MARKKDEHFTVRCTLAGIEMNAANPCPEWWGVIMGERVSTVVSDYFRAHPDEWPAFYENLKKEGEGKGLVEKEAASLGMTVEEYTENREERAVRRQDRLERAHRERAQWLLDREDIIDETGRAALAQLRMEGKVVGKEVRF